jgi:ribulose-phosphate 3-epimerase
LDWIIWTFLKSLIGGGVFFFSANRRWLKKVFASSIFGEKAGQNRRLHPLPLIHWPGRVCIKDHPCRFIMVELLPSILSADFAHLADQVAAAERGGGTAIHVDVMDGHFVPNITLGPPVVKSLRKATNLPLDCHLMIENPNDYISAFADAGADWVSVHYEACTHLHRSIELIAHHGMKPGVVLNPATRVDLIVDILPMLHHVLIMSVNPGFGGQQFIHFSLKKLRRLAELRQELGLAFRIEVDGGVAHDTVAQVVQAGAELLVAGNAVFGAGRPEQDARELLAAARQAAGE